MKKNFIAGFLIGALIFGSGAAYAATVIATPTTSPVYVDGKQINVTAYNINGNNYFKLRDLGAAIDFGVTYDNSTKIINIDTAASYTEEPAAQGSNSADVITVPQSDAQFIPKVGDKILCDDGTIYEIKDMSKFDASMFAAAPLPPLPASTCDWSQFPELPLPKVEVKHFANNGTDRMFILNLYEMRRMQYTLYNAIGSNNETWENGKLKLSVKGSPLAKLQFMVGEDDFAVQSFWPWRESELLKACSVPTGTYVIEAWDVYSNGIFQYTEYIIQKL